MNPFLRGIFLAASLLALLPSFAQHAHSQDGTAMNSLNSLHEAHKSVSALQLFKGSEGKVIALHLQQNGLLESHITQVEALLVCVSGKAVFENEKGEKYTLREGDFLRIEPLVKHWVKGIRDSQLLLIK